MNEVDGAKWPATATGACNGKHQASAAARAAATLPITLTSARPAATDRRHGTLSEGGGDSCASRRLVGDGRSIDARKPTPRNRSSTQKLGESLSPCGPRCSHASPGRWNALGNGREYRPRCRGRVQQPHRRWRLSEQVLEGRLVAPVAYRSAVPTWTCAWRTAPPNRHLHC